MTSRDGVAFRRDIGEISGEAGAAAGKAVDVGVRVRPSAAEAEEAVRVLLGFAGDDPDREGLRDTPRRVIDAYREMFSGYLEDPVRVLDKTFPVDPDYVEPVVLTHIGFESNCEHHVLPILGQAHVAYVPSGRVVGISKLARVVDIFARRLQTQENMTVQIGKACEAALAPRGVAVEVVAVHQCMTTRGVRKPGVETVTSYYSGVFQERQELRQNVWRRRRESEGG